MAAWACCLRLILAMVGPRRVRLLRTVWLQASWRCCGWQLPSLESVGGRELKGCQWGFTRSNTLEGHTKGKLCHDDELGHCIAKAWERIDRREKLPRKRIFTEISKIQAPTMSMVKIESTTGDYNTVLVVVQPCILDPTLRCAPSQYECLHPAYISNAITILPHAAMAHLSQLYTAVRRTQCVSPMPGH